MAAHDFFLLSPTWSDDSTISGSTAATGYPLTNLQNKWPHRKWRSSSLSTPYVQLSMASGYGGSYTVHVWLGYTNARSSDKWRIRAAADASPDTSPDYDSGEVVIIPAAAPSYLDSIFPDGVHAYGTFTASFSVVSMRLDFNFTGHPDGYVEAARLFVASEAANVTRFMVWEPSRGPAYGAQVPSERPAISGSRADGGPLYPEDREIPVGSSYDFKHLSFDDYRKFREFVRINGAARDVVALQNTAEPQYLMEYTNHGILRGVEAVRAMKPSVGVPTFDVTFDVESISG